MPVDRKPGSVLVGHLSSPDVATRLKRLSTARRAVVSGHLLAAGRVYLSNDVTVKDCGLLPHSFHHFQVRFMRTWLCRFCGTFPRITPGCR